jgi:hypothetical protein
MYSIDRKDVIWINLKVLSKIPPFHRLNTQNELFYIESNSFFHPAFLLRWVRGDNRILTVKRIDELISKSAEMIDRLDGESVKSLKQHLTDSQRGLINMKQTYEGDITIISSIERLIDKIATIVPPGNGKTEKKISKNKK